MRTRRDCGPPDLIVKHNIHIDLVDGDKPNLAFNRTLYRAVQEDHFEVLKVLVAIGPDSPHSTISQDIIKNKVFEWAINFDRPDVVEHLLNAVTLPDMGLCLASQLGRPEIVKRLISAGADLGSTNGSEGPSPMIATIGRGNFDIVELLLEAGAPVNVKHGETSPLHEAVHEGDVTMVKRLISAGVDLHHEAQTLVGLETALQLAYRRQGKLPPESPQLRIYSEINKALE